jgi:hypothetical protein
VPLLFFGPLALSSQWFHFAVVSPVGNGPVLVTNRNTGAAPKLFSEGKGLCYLRYCLAEQGWPVIRSPEPDGAILG